MKWLAPQERICPVGLRTGRVRRRRWKGGQEIDWLSHSSIRARGA